MSPVRALPRAVRPLPALQVAMAAQGVAFAGGTAAFPPGRWLPLALGAGAGSLVLAWFLGRRTRSAWVMALGFEALLVALGVAAFQAAVDLPGSFVSALIAVALLLPAVRRLFAEAEVPASRPTRLVPPPVVAAATAAPARPTLPPPPPITVLAAPAAPTTSPPSLPPPPPPGWQPQPV